MQRRLSNCLLAFARLTITLFVAELALQTQGVAPGRPCSSPKLDPQPAAWTAAKVGGGQALKREDYPAS